MSREFSDYHYSTDDGLSLYARRYAGDLSKLPLLCMHGLSRNSADFHELLTALPDRPAISVDQRGRGRSQYDNDPSRYRPDIYCQDMLTLLEGLNISKVIAVGTSMGGLMSFMIHAMRPELFAGMIINDIGPDIEPTGLSRLRSYVGQTTEFASWHEAANAIKAQGPDIFPDFTHEDWLAFARRVCVEKDGGGVRFAYDPAIASGLSETEATAAPPDLWPVFLSEPFVPMLILRGATSDILSGGTASRMADERPNTTLVTVPGRGHAPTLTEPTALFAIESFLKDLP